MATTAQDTGVRVDPGYAGADHDVALIKLDQPVAGVTVTNLPDAWRDRAGGAGQVGHGDRGWGHSAQSAWNLPGPALYPEWLQEVRTPIVSADDCAVAYGGVVTALKLCAGRTGEDSCGGDSGGPLFTRVPSKEE